MHHKPCKTPGCPNRAIIDDDYCPEHMSGTKHSKKVFDAMNCRMVVLLNSEDKPISYRISDKPGNSIELGIVGLSDLEGLIAQAKRQQEAAGL